MTQDGLPGFSGAARVLSKLAQLTFYFRYYEIVLAADDPLELG